MIHKLKTASNNLAVTSRTSKGPLPWRLDKNRRIQIGLFKLRSGHTPYILRGRFYVNIQQNCLHGCDELDDARNVLLKCLNYAEERGKI